MFSVKNVIYVGLLVFISSAKENNTPLFGTWTGTIGKAKISACFQAEKGKYYTNGSYYYLKYRQPIRLNEISDNLWAEPDSCEWVIKTTTDSIVSGKWVNRNKTVSLPIKLSFMGTCKDGEESSEQPCGCDLFNSHIEKMPPITVDTVKDSGYRYFRELKVASDNITMEWFELCGGGETRKKINQVLRKGFPENNSDAKCFYSCRRGTLAAFGSGECDFSQITKSYLWTAQYLEVSESNAGFCGGAHDFSGISYRTFDLSTGEEINLWSWIKRLPEYNEELNTLILSKSKRDKNDPDDTACVSMLNENKIYSIKLDTVGLVFYTEFGHCCRNCDEEFVVPFQEMMPFLTSEGKSKVKLIFQQVSGKRN
jgi:hypothetical protein